MEQFPIQPLCVRGDYHRLWPKVLSENGCQRFSFDLEVNLEQQRRARVIEDTTMIGQSRNAEKVCQTTESNQGSCQCGTEQFFIVYHLFIFLLS